MPRNIVICCDGTDNQFGADNTNVVRLVQCLDRSTTDQLLYYDPGVGTLPEPGWITRVGQRLSELAAMAFGTDLTRHLLQAYSFLMDFWEPGDQVFLFGFSRGAYTVRVLAAMLHQIGLLPHGSSNMLPYALRQFGAIRRKDASDTYWTLCNDFRETFARDAGAAHRRFRTHFLGVWDTVSSVGWIWNPTSYPFTHCNPSIDCIRHAVSLDERRAFYRQNLFGAASGQDVEQFWFPGVHSDIGGGYPAADGGLWRLPFCWILDEAIAQGLKVDDTRRSDVLQKPPVSSQPWNDHIHKSLHGAWWIVEYLPKKRWQANGQERFRCNRGRPRALQNGNMIDHSTLERIRGGDYKPKNMSDRFTQEVCRLDVIPNAYPFQW